MISVCMAMFNGERYLEEQLLSILTQLDEHDEVIIVDDASSDRSVQLIRDIQDKRIRLLLNGENVGPVASFERAIAAASGKYIFLSDHDDIWKLDKVQTMRECFESSGALAVVSDAHVVNDQKEIILPSVFAWRNSAPGFWRNLRKNAFIGCCMAFRSEARAFILPFPKHLFMHDVWIGLCCSIAGEAFFLDKSLIDYRRHGQTFTTMIRGNIFSILKMRSTTFSLVLARLPRILRWRLQRTSM